jgi:putative membrane protein
MKLLKQTLAIARIEAGFFVRFPKLLLATVFVAFIPALYAVIYLSSVWDPQSRTGALAVGLVNLDQGLTYQGQVFNMGEEVINRLKTTHTFGYQELQDEDKARKLVRQGKLAFALIIPQDFSSNAVPAAQAGLGKLVVFTSAGNNFESASMAKEFAQTLAHDVNLSLNEQRWSMVLIGTAGSQDRLQRLREGVTQLRQGSKELSVGADKTAAGATALSAGAAKLDDGIEQLTGGVRQLGGGLKTMESRLPANAELARLNAGTDALVKGHAELGKGLGELKSGSQRLRVGVAKFAEEAKDSLFTPARVGEGLDEVSDGLTQLDQGIQSARDAQLKIAEGAVRVDSGVETLTDGVRSLGAGLRTAIARMPADAQLDQINNGALQLTGSSATLADATQKIKAGAQHLNLGIETLVSSIPMSLQTLEGSAQGLAHSVEPALEIDAPVQNHGSGFASNILPGALWLGAAIAAFLFHVRVLPDTAQLYATPAKLLGKVLIPIVLVFLQTMLVLITVLFILEIHISHVLPFALTLAVASITFLLIVIALTRAFGDAGKALAMIFLALQISASGGILPVELSGSIFEQISPWLPITWVVKGLKASMFGAFEGGWLLPLLLVALAGLAAALLASKLGRWRYVHPDATRPAIDF